jgi:hypothetical protein
VKFIISYSIVKQFVYNRKFFCRFCCKFSESALIFYRDMTFLTRCGPFLCFETSSHKYGVLERMSPLNTFEKPAGLLMQFYDRGEESWLLKGVKLRKIARGATIKCCLI